MCLAINEKGIRRVIRQFVREKGAELARMPCWFFQGGRCVKLYAAGICDSMLSSPTNYERPTAFREKKNFVK